MFEKEAEEIAKDIYIHHFDDDVIYPNVLKAITVGVQQGAEFGYAKANEWHYVKDELPDEGTYLVVWRNDKGYKEIFILKYEEDDEEELHWVDDDYEVQDEYVIAWKEIVLPELKESE